MTRRRRVQLRAAAGSMGQGNERACHSSAPLTASNNAAPPKTPALCSDSQTSCGNVDTSPTSVAPAPIETRAAGSTQHISGAEDTRNAT